MKKRLFLLSIGFLLSILWVSADETVTVTANSDISENLDLKMVATLFGQAKDLEQFETMLNNPDSAFSNLDLNGDGQVDYLRVIETANATQHLVVIQAVLAKDIYQDVASIYVEKDPDTESVTVQVIGDEYIYGTNYIIEPVYIYRPYIYDWFWGPDWICWHSPYYWDYWPGWWHPYYCVTPYIYWDHCYWHHHYHPICSYRTGYHPHHHYHAMYEPIRRADYAARHPERSFSTRNASRGGSNARVFDAERRNATRSATQGTARAATDRTSTRAISADNNASRSFGSSNIRTSATSSRSNTATTGRTTTNATRRSNNDAVATRSSSASSRATSATTRTATATTTRTATTGTTRTSTPTATSRTAGTSISRSAATSTRSYNNSGTYNRSSSASYSSPSRSTNSTMRSSSAGSSRSTGSMSSGRTSGGSSRSSGGGSTSRSAGGSRR